MAWVRLDDQFYQHPKMLRAGPLGLAMQVAALCYSNRYLTDGFIPHAAVSTLLNWDELDEHAFNGIGGTCWRAVGALVDVGSWEEVEGGYHIHDYDQYQPTKAQVLAEKAQKAAAGQAGGIAAAKARAKAPAVAKVKQKASESQAEGVAESKPVPVPNPVPESRNPVPVKESSTPSMSRRRRETEITTEFIDAMVVKYAPVFGDAESVRASISEATNHKAMLKRIDKRQYLRTWLDNDIKYRAQRAFPANGHTPQPAREPVTYADSDFLPLDEKLRLEGKL